MTETIRLDYSHGGMRALCLVLVALIASANPAFSSPTKSAVPHPTEIWTQQLAGMELKLEAPDVTDEDLIRSRDLLDTIQAEVAAVSLEQAPILAARRDDLATLGPRPSAGEQPEAERIAGRRHALGAEIAALQGQLKEADLVSAQVNRLRGVIATLRRDRFKNRILARGPSPFSVSVWSRVAPEIGKAHTSLDAIAANLFRHTGLDDQLRQSALIVATILFFATLVMWPVRRWLMRRYGRDPAVVTPTYLQLLRAMLVMTMAKALLPSLIAALVYGFLVNEALLSVAGRDVADALLFAFILFTWSVTLIRASMAPADPTWRVIPVPTPFARRLRNVTAGLTLALSLDIVFSALITTYNVRLEITVVRDYAMTLLVSALILSLVARRRFWLFDSESNARPRWRIGRALVSLVLLAAPILGAFGYVTLGRFVALQIFFGGGVLLLLLVVRQMGRELIAYLTSHEPWFVDRLHGSLATDEAGLERVRFWTSLALDVVLVPLGVLIELFLWGSDWHDISGFLYQAVFGVRIGELTISLSDIAVAVLVFTAAVLITRAVRNILAKQVFPQTRLDRGLRDSIGVGVGYLGVALGAALAISALGLNLSNLAIIAGALSVGIGFGLQTVVNNFVAGLILLLERPVKVGDWISVGGVEGFVRKISVRSTEIQTFDHANIFVPNSELTSKALTNLSYPDTTGRLGVPVGVAYGSDTAKVRDLLLAVGKGHASVLAYPSPSALFLGFGDSALNFELRAFIRDIRDVVTVSSDLCFAIDAAFRAAGIEIPYPQRDLHVRSLPLQPDAKNETPKGAVGERAAQVPVADLSLEKQVAKDISSGNL